MNELFSPMENEILKILGTKKMSIKQITERYIEKHQSKALYPNQVISGAVKNINAKCARHALTWFLNSTGRGRGGKEVWKDKP